MADERSFYLFTKFRVTAVLLTSKMCCWELTCWKNAICINRR